jgi:acetyl esterase/lipase
VSEVPLVPQTGDGLAGRALRATAGFALRVSLRFSPRPAALLIRKVFAAGGAETARRLAPHEPAGIVAVVDERYGSDPDMLLDVYRPVHEQALPTVVWVHGGGWVGGSKEELAVYCRLLASKGYGVVAPRYSLAPERRYPTPLRQLMEVFSFVEVNAARLRLDASRLVVAGDSAGAHIAAQVAALVTTPGYADAVGVAPTLTPTQLRGVVLACGPFDLALLQAAASERARRLVAAVLWAYSGDRHFSRSPAFATASVVDHLSPAFPPALVTVGNADPLRRHSELLVEKLRTHGVESETLFFPESHEPQLGHEYQFDLELEAGRLFLSRLSTFLERRLGGAGGEGASRADAPSPRR